MRKVIYVSFGRLTDKMARDWCIDYLIAQGACVEYWDIVALVRAEHVEHGALDAEYLRVFRSFAEVEQALRLPENRSALYVMLITYSGRLARIFQLLSRERCRMVNFAWGALPHNAGWNWSKFAAWASRPDRCVSEVINRSRASALRKLRLVAPYEITFAAGAVSIAGSAHAMRTVPINYFDYDLFVKARVDGAPRLVGGDYCVFLDCYLPFHSDLEFCGYPRVEAERYFRSLNRFFDLLERAYGWRVVIASHPRARYDDATFAGRPMHRLVTAELVRDARCVLTHWSTALSYAVLNAKPLLFIYTDDIATTYARHHMRDMRHFARCLDAPMCNIDTVRETRGLAIPSVNTACYQRYKYDFLTSPESEHTPTQEIFWREIRAQ
jgi:hypothetical protein